MRGKAHKKQSSRSNESISPRESTPLDLKPIDPSPCSVECPLGTNVKAYVSLIAAGLFSEALEEVRKTNPFPGICGRVCPHPCEDACRRADIDQPLAIAALKRFVADYELRRGVIPRYRPKEKKQERVAVVGSGPAGLTCAADLAREGYSVTVFESLPVAGGMLAVGIPSYRLPKEILSVEIAAVEALGVEIKLNARVGESRKLDDLTREFDAVFIATGLQRPRMLGIPGEKEAKRGVINWISLMRDVALNRAEKPGDKLVIVGGGNSAVDCARAMVRLGAKEVQIVYRRSHDEMPAYKDEIKDVQEEGVKINFLCTPVRLIVEEGRLVGVECVRTRLGKKDKSGRQKPLPVPDSEFVIPCDGIIPAVGQELEPSFLDEKQSLTVSDNGLLVMNTETMAPNGLFAGGDVTSGAASVVEAIQAGHRGARSIIRFLNHLPPEAPSVETEELFRELMLEPEAPQKAFRIEGSRLSVTERRNCFDEVDQGLTEAQAVSEAQHCLRCGPCGECSECVGVCEGKQIIIEPAGTEESQRMKEPGTLVRIPLDIHRKIAALDAVSVSYGGKQYNASSIISRIDQDLCRGCGLCEETCGYRAVRVTYCGNGVFTAQVTEDMCRGCGACVAVCPTGAVDQNYFTTGKISLQVQEKVNNHRAGLPLILFTCWWNSALRTDGEELPAEIIPVMCIGRIPAGDVLRAFEKGAQGVLFIGCGEDCHYGFGKESADRNLQCLSDIMSLLGIDRRRLRIIENPREDKSGLMDEVRDFFNEVKKLGTNRIGGVR